MCRAGGNWEVWVLYETGGIVNPNIVRAYTVSKPVGAFVKIKSTMLFAIREAAMRYLCS